MIGEERGGAVRVRVGVGGWECRGELEVVLDDVDGCGTVSAE